jgi:hypothetical protein
LVFANDFKKPVIKPAKPSLKNQSNLSSLNDSYYVKINSNNKFEPKMNTFEYKNAAKNAFQRRMKYDPKESINTSKVVNEVINNSKMSYS